jgi:hypothetical protein
MFCSDPNGEFGSAGRLPCAKRNWSSRRLIKHSPIFFSIFALTLIGSSSKIFNITFGVGIDVGFEFVRCFDVRFSGAVELEVFDLFETAVASESIVKPFFLFN